VFTRCLLYVLQIEVGLSWYVGCSVKANSEWLLP
jgi:hypothetical protein